VINNVWLDMAPGVSMQSPKLIQEQRKILLDIAKQSILSGLENHQPLSIAIANYPRGSEKAAAYALWEISSTNGQYAFKLPIQPRNCCLIFKVTKVARGVCNSCG